MIFSCLSHLISRLSIVKFSSITINSPLKLKLMVSLEIIRSWHSIKNFIMSLIHVSHGMDEVGLQIFQSIQRSTNLKVVLLRLVIIDPYFIWLKLWLIFLAFGLILIVFLGLQCLFHKIWFSLTFLGFIFWGLKFTFVSNVWVFPFHLESVLFTFGFFEYLLKGVVTGLNDFEYFIILVLAFILTFWFQSNVAFSRN